jgi:hypothetical protein
MRRPKLRPRRLPTTLPDDVLRDGVDFAPTFEERALDWHREQMQLAIAEVKRLELAEQREWLEAQTRRLARVAMELDETERKIKLQDEMDRQDEWWKRVSEEAKVSTERVLEHCQKQLDGRAYEKMVARAEAARKDMDRDNARLERLSLLKRGVLRGTRKQFAAGHLAY